MHSSQDATNGARTMSETNRRDSNLSFPPIQRTGLLRSAASRSKQQRSMSQAANFSSSASRLLVLLNARPLEDAAAL